MVQLKSIYVYLQLSTSQLGFINALHAQVASIGTVPNSFVLFLFYCKAACFRYIKSIGFIINPTFPCIFIGRTYATIILVAG